MRPDATIIGAGPAGCCAAILLARSNWNVTLIEQHRFPRDKVCGECLSALGIEVLTRLGIDLSPEPVQLRHAAFVSLDGHTATMNLPHAMWGISRRTLDSSLLDAAQKSGATILQPAR